MSLTIRFLGAATMAILIACGDEPDGSNASDAGSVPAPAPTDPVQEWELLLLPSIDAELQAGRLDSAISLCRAGLQEDSTRIVLYNLMASALAGQGKPDEAAATLQTAVRISPTFLEGWVNLAGLAMRQGRYNEATPFLQRAAELDPQSSQSHRRLAQVYLMTGQPARAETHVRRAMEILRDDATLHFLLGEALTGLGGEPEALEAYIEAVRLDPGYLDGQDRVTRLATSLGRVAVADSSQARATHLRAIAGGDEDAAQTMAQLRMAIENAPEDALHHARLGGFFLYHDYKPEALTLFERAADLEPDNTWLLTEFGGLLSRKGDGPEALDYFGRALRLNPDHVPALLNRGGVLNALGRFDEAVRDLDRAVSVAPDDPSARFYLGATYISMGRIDEARRYLEEARDLLPETDTQLLPQVQAALESLTPSPTEP